MKRKIILSLIITVVIIGAALSVTEIMNWQPSSNGEGVPKETCNRIISLSPSITETLYALGLGDKVIGVTRYCTFPPEARQKANIGGYFDPNYELIASLQPDLVIVLLEQQEIRNYLSELGFKFLIVRKETVSEILSTIAAIGDAAGAETRAQQLIADIKGRMQKIQSLTRNLRHPRVIISVERALGTGTLEGIYIAGRKTFFNELIELAGGDNAYRDDKIPYPTLSAEGIMHLNPDIILEMIPDIEARGLDEKEIIHEWDCIPEVKAIKNNRVFLFTQNYATIPGPRFILLLEDLARILHPEIQWESA